MFVGFIAVVVILLVIVGLMSSGGNQTQDGARYITEAKKVKTVTHLMSGEAKFYYVRNETFLGLTMDYFKDTEFAAEKFVPTSNMSSDDWSGWPTADGGFPDPYTGGYIKVGGPAGDDLRIIATSINDGKNLAIYLVKRKDNNIDPTYLQILEKTLASDPNFVGS